MHQYTGTVYEEFLPDVKRELKRMAKRAETYNVFFDYEIAPFSDKVKVLVYEHGRHVEAADFWTDGVKVTIRYDIIKANGWTPVAMIEVLPNTERRLVTCFTDDIEPKEAWFYSDMHCDHCNKIRQRTTVIICRNDDGREIQVGKGCLKDYTGIDPLSIVTKAEIADWFIEEDEDGYDPSSFNPSRIYFDVEKVIGIACDIIKEYGYVKSSNPDSTKDRVLEAIYSREEPSEEGEAKASLIRDWLLMKEINDTESFEYNCLALLESGYVDAKRIGYIAYLPVAYDKAMEMEAKWKRRLAQEKSDSQYVGEVGKRIEVIPVYAKIVTSWQNQFGTTFIWKIADSAGNVFTWKTSNSVYEKEKLPVSIKGTVKAHTEYRGICQTELTRCKCFY